MSGRNEVTPSPLQPRALSHLMHLPLNPNPQRSADSRQSDMTSMDHMGTMMNSFLGPTWDQPRNAGQFNAVAANGRYLSPHTQPQTPETETRYMETSFQVNPLAWSKTEDPLMDTVGDTHEAPANHAEAQAALAEDEDEPPLEGAELTAAEAEVEGRFEMDLVEARATMRTMQSALEVSWSSLDECSREKVDRRSTWQRSRSTSAACTTCSPWRMAAKTPRIAWWRCAQGWKPCRP